MPAITNVNDLQNISLNLAGNYWLSNDIDASGFGFVPLGTFTGTLDGKNHVVTDLTITVNGGGNRSGALITINQGIVKNLGLEDCVISINSTNAAVYAAGIAETNDGGTIQNCHTTGSITGISPSATQWVMVGGIVNYNQNNGIVTDCYSTAAITATSGRHVAAGGLVAWNVEGTISESFATGNIIGSSSSGSPTVWIYMGGLVGLNGYTGSTDGIINDTFARGNVTATGGTIIGVGGLLGHNDSVGSTATNSYSTGIPTATSGTGGFCGDNDGTITNCFWDTQTSGTAVSDGGTGKTTAQMKTKATFTVAGWDFIIIWFINGITNDGYPFFFAMPPEPLPDAPRAEVLVEDKITLEAVRNVEMAAGGRFYVDEDGKATYKSRHARNP